MTHTRIVLCAVALVAAAPFEARTQTLPPLLSTSPNPPAGVMPDPSQMSGLPLQVGDLPPGVVAVRVIRRSFADNIAGQRVELHVGQGNVLAATTGKDGRAQFNGLQVGDTVQARAVVDAEPLGSGRFPLPAQGGVRLVLVAGVGAGIPADVVPPPTAAPAPVAVATTAAPTPRYSRTASALMLMFTSAGLGFVWFTRRATGRATAAVATSPESAEPSPLLSPERAEPSPRLSRAALVAQRAVVFERLVRLEEARAAGRADGSDTAAREHLVDELIALDTAIEAPRH